MSAILLKTHIQTGMKANGLSVAALALLIVLMLALATSVIANGDDFVNRVRSRGQDLTAVPTPDSEVRINETSGSLCYRACSLVR